MAFAICNCSQRRGRLPTIMPEASLNMSDNTMRMLVKSAATGDQSSWKKMCYYFSVYFFLGGRDLMKDSIEQSVDVDIYRPYKYEFPDDLEQGNYHVCCYLVENTTGKVAGTIIFEDNANGFFQCLNYGPFYRPLTTDLENRIVA